MLGTPHLLGADVPPGGAIGVTQSGRIATGECQYVSRALGAALVTQSGRTATGEYQCVSRVLGADTLSGCK